MSGDASPARSDRGAIAAVFVALLALCALTSPGSLNAVDTWPALGEAVAILDTGSLRFDRLDPAVYGSEVAKVMRHATANTPEPTNKYGFGLHLVLVPAYAASRVLAAATGATRLDAASFVVSFVNPLAVAATGAAVLAILRRLGHSVRRSLWTALAATVGGFLWPISAISYFDPVQAAFVAALLLQALRVRERPGAGRLATLVVLAAVTPLMKLTLAPIVGLACLVPFAAPGGLRRAILPLAATAALAAALVGAVNTARFGGPFETGYVTEKFGSPELSGVATLLTSFDRGLVWFFPLVPLAVLGTVRLARRDGRLAAIVAAACVLHLAIHLVHRSLHGGNCLGPRYLAPTVPFLAIGIAEAAGAVTARARPAVAAGALAAAVAWTAPMATIAYFLVPVTRDAVAAAGGSPRAEPVPVATMRLLAATPPTPPSRIPLSLLSASPVEGSIVYADRDNGGWQWWWVKPHPRLPAALRYGAAAGFAVALLLAARRVAGAVRGPGV